MPRTKGSNRVTKQQVVDRHAYLHASHRRGEHDEDVSSSRKRPRKGATKGSKKGAKRAASQRGDPTPEVPPLLTPQPSPQQTLEVPPLPTPQPSIQQTPEVPPLPTPQPSPQQTHEVPPFPTPQPSRQPTIEIPPLPTHVPPPVPTPQPSTHPTPQPTDQPSPLPTSQRSAVQESGIESRSGSEFGSGSESMSDSGSESEDVAVEVEAPQVKTTLTIHKQPPFAGGPLELSLLHRYPDHIASWTWHSSLGTTDDRYEDRLELKVSNVGLKLANMPLEGDAHRDVLTLVEATGLLHLVRSSYQETDSGLVSALVERWHEETSSFHMSFGEMTVTLDDVSALLHLPTSGRFYTPAALSRLEMAETCVRLLGGHVGF
ncbi:uncharacterized protein LOC130719173 [Lotus japonicus]|uniref:uncharacterized protein LOC130719173 n=1 Tax=Lotus japonicus TaxID=34305 RepID=UPI00258887DD|nr:uncharacterized protein LOC130719173 [Lotus japonicus]